MGYEENIFSEKRDDIEETTTVAALYKLTDRFPKRFEGCCSLRLINLIMKLHCGALISSSLCWVKS